MGRRRSRSRRRRGRRRTCRTMLKRATPADSVGSRELRLMGEARSVTKIRRPPFSHASATGSWPTLGCRI